MMRVHYFNIVIIEYKAIRINKNKIDELFFFNWLFRLPKLNVKQTKNEMQNMQKWNDNEKKFDKILEKK